MNLGSCTTSTVWASNLSFAAFSFAHVNCNKINPKCHADLSSENRNKYKSSWSWAAAEIILIMWHEMVVRKGVGFGQ